MGFSYLFPYCFLGSFLMVVCSIIVYVRYNCLWRRFGRAFYLSAVLLFFVGILAAWDYGRSIEKAHQIKADSLNRP